MIASLLDRFNVNISGQGEKVLMFGHGLGCDQKMWRYVTPAFEDNYKVILFDYIGSGHSDLAYYNREKYSTLNAYANDVNSILEELQLTNITFIGHSVSGMIGMLAAISNPGLFDKIIMVGPSPCYLNDKGYHGGFERREVEELLEVMKHNFYSWAGFFAPKVIGEANQKKYSDELQQSFCNANPEITHEFASITFLSDHREDLRKLKIPALIIQCEEDIIAPVSVGQYLKENLEGSSLYIMKTTGHCPHLTSPEETIDAIKRFIE